MKIATICSILFIIQSYSTKHFLVNKPSPENFPILFATLIFINSFPVKTGLLKGIIQ